MKGWETRSNTRPIPRSVEKRTSLPILHSPLWSPGCEWEAPRSPKPDATASQRFPVCTGWRANPNRTESRRWCRTSGSLPHGLCGRTKRTNKTEPKLNNCRYTVKGPQRAPTKNCGKGFLFAGCLLFSLLLQLLYFLAHFIACNNNKWPLNFIHCCLCPLLVCNLGS